MNASPKSNRIPVLIVGLFLGFSILIPADANTDTIINFSGNIAWKAGPFEDVFSIGTPIVGNLVFDETKPDSNIADSKEGRYHDALKSLTATISGVGSWSATKGNLSVFNNIDTSDQFQADSSGASALGTAINGQTINSLGVLFFGNSPYTMLTSDSLPDSNLNWDFGNIFFGFNPIAGSNIEYTSLGFGPQQSSVPEPATMFFLGSGLIGLIVLRRKLKN